MHGTIITMENQRTHKRLLLLVVTTLLHSHLAYSLMLEDYQTASFTNPFRNSEFTRLAIHNQTGEIYVGGGNAIYRLAADFSRQESVNTAVDCDGDKCPVNYNKILLVDYAADMLITCGSEKDGSCQTRALDNIVEPMREDDTPVATSGKLSTEAIIAPGPLNGGVNTLYVAATYDEKRYNAGVYPVTRRTLLAPTDVGQMFDSETFAAIFFDRSNSGGFEFIINYITAFVKETHHNDFTYQYTYFVTLQKQDDTNIFDKTYSSKINRVCQDGGFSSYTEIVLDCQDTIHGEKYNLIQAAYVGAAGPDLAQSLGLNDGDDVFFGVFAKQEGVDGNIPSSQTALCVYKLEDIEEKFIEGIHGCLKNGQEFQLSYLYYSDCPGISYVTREQAERQQCTAVNWANAYAYIPLVSTAVLDWTDIQPSSIITAIHRNHTIAYVGTAEGNLVKVHLENGTHGREYERFPLGSPVLRDAHVDEAQEMVTLLTEQTLFKLRVENCREYTTCYECIGVNGGEDGDPYCGWCTLEKKCTRYDVCPMSDVYTRWLPYNSAQCIDISNVVPYGQPITNIQQLIILTVEQLPDLSGGHTYQCMFGNTPPSAAIKSNNRLTCLTPAGSSIPKIQSGNDYVTMQLYVISTETDVKFVQRDFYFYECSTHQMCVACTNSSWACDWCIYSNTCTHESSSTCSDDVSGTIINGINNPVISNIQGYEECPQLAAQDEEILVPHGVSKPISVTGVHLPDQNRATSYKCILNIEGDNVETDATRMGDILTCGARMYIYRADASVFDVNLSVVWNNNRRLDDLHGFKVTLYKCDIGRPDCSRCVSHLTARPELKCGWCSMDDKCIVERSPDCSGRWMSSATNINCPNPYLLEVQPPSGPLNGNTIIAISGTDLGKQFSDVTAIKVGTKNCDTNGLEDRYIAGSSVSCKTMSGTNNSVDDITVIIRGANEDLQESTGEVQFTYRDPSISSFDPRKGLTAGGTVVTISGQYLDACSEISAIIGSECIMNRMDDVINTTTVRCRTTSSPAGTSHKVTLLFDGTERQSDDEFTYRPNSNISAVLPLKTIESGGITLTVRGTGFELSQTPQIVIYIGDEQFKEVCLVLNETIMLCKTPNTKAASDNILRMQREAVGLASFGFIIGDVSSLLRWSDDNNAAMQYFADPEYDLFETKSKSGDLELIMGKNLKDASSIKDVTVYIGTVKAITISLTQNTLVIELPKKYPGRECINGNRTRDPCVVVYHGNLMFYLGMLRYPAGSSNLTITLISCVMVVLVLLIIVILVCYVIRYKRFLKDRNAVILEKLRLLQKLVEEEIDNLAAESSPAQSFIILPNNVQINSQDVKIRYIDLSIGKKLGHGAFGEVCHAILTTGGMCHQVAVKSIQGNQDASTIVQFLEEGLIMKDFDHPNVLGLVGLTFDPDGNPLVVLPFMINGDLLSFMKKTTVEITSTQKLNFAIEAAKGMAYLTKKKFVHRDIAARNCMVDDKLVVKIGDFGRSRDMEEADYYTSGDMKAKLPVKWMAPESLDKRVYNEKTDVWSYGVLLWEIFTNGKKPYRTIANKDVYYYITSGNRLPCPEDCREDVYDIMMQCWKSNPKERIGFQELSLRFITVLSLYTYAWIDEEPGLIDEQGVSNMHPLEERKVQDDESSVKVYNRYSYLHPVEGNNEAVSIEMQNMNPM